MIDEEIKARILESVRKGFIECEIPDHCRNGIELYLTDGILPGSFLTAVLSNDFKEVCARADMKNEKCLKNYAMLMYHFMPSESQGSEIKVNAWLNRFEEPVAKPESSL